MADDELMGRVRDLRAQGLSPKQIARALGVAPATVAPLIRMIAEQAAADAPEPALVGCWVSAGWSLGLGVDVGREWPDHAKHGTNKSGLVGVLVARVGPRSRGVSVCGYLVDTYCLGVKDALGPRLMKDHELQRFVGRFFSSFGGHPVRAPLELANELVWGGVEYARGLGFEPAADFTPTTGHLGSYSGPGAIDFGCDGMPFYVQGPYDDAATIMRTLDRSVGADNFHFIAELPLDAASFLAPVGVT